MIKAVRRGHVHVSFQHLESEALGWRKQDWKKVSAVVSIAHCPSTATSTGLGTITRLSSQKWNWGTEPMIYLFHVTWLSVSLQVIFVLELTLLCLLSPRKRWKPDNWPRLHSRSGMSPAEGMPVSLTSNASSLESPTGSFSWANNEDSGDMVWGSKY